MLTREQRTELFEMKEGYLEFLVENPEMRETQPFLWHGFVSLYEETKLMLEHDEHEKIMSTATESEETDDEPISD